MGNITPALAFAAIVVLAQTQSPKNGSISGVVRDEGTGTPISDVSVSVTINSRYANGTIYMSPDSKEIRVPTDAQGRYRLDDLPASMYRVTARGKDPVSQYRGKMVNLRAGQDLTSFDFTFADSGVIAGRVLDQNREPIPGTTLYLVSKEYTMGGVGYFLKSSTRTDDQGEFTLQRVAPGFPCLLIAMNTTPLPAVSESPSDSKLRKAAYVPTYYPNAADPEGAVPLVLRAGERREGIEVVLRRAPSFCIEGTMAAGAGPAAGTFMIFGQEVSYGPSRSSGSAVAAMPQTGRAGQDGKFRVCGLRAGRYRVAAYFPLPGNPNAPAPYAMLDVTILDKDATGVRLIAGPGLTVLGSVVWDSTPPDSQANANLSIYLRPLNLTIGLPGRPSGSARTSIPGEFSFPGIWLDDYSVATILNVPGVYVKDITYGGTSVLNGPLRPGSAASNELRVVLARDGGSIAVKVTGKDGAAVPDIHVVIFPAEVRSEAALAETLIVGETDQNGNYSYGVLGPGKYRVLATASRVDRAVDSIDNLWAARTRAKDVELGPNATAQLTLEPSKID